jgi:hypothetical protein
MLGELEPLFSAVGREDLYGYVLHSSIEDRRRLTARPPACKGRLEENPLVLIRSPLRSAQPDEAAARTG